MSRMVTEAMVEAACKAYDPRLFSGIEQVAHQAASPTTVALAQGRIRSLVRQVLEAALNGPAAEQKAEPVRKVQKMARFCAEIAWDTAFAWAIDHGRTDQEAYNAASAVRENVLVHALQDDALSTQAIEARNAVIEGPHNNMERKMNEALDDTIRSFDVAAFVEAYEFRGDGGDYTPTDTERALLIDGISCALADFAELYTISAAALRAAEARQL